MKRVLKLPGLIGHGREVWEALRYQMAGQGKIAENHLHVSAGVSWLLRAQVMGGGGFARKYCLYSGWDKPYTETTGYIIPTMIAAGKYLKQLPAQVPGERGLADFDKSTMSARRAAEWLLGMQKESGAFCDIDTGEEQVFDTGQVLAGLVAAFKEWADERFLEAAVNAGKWLAAVQEKDGSWERNAYNRTRHSYYIKVAAALLQLGGVTGGDIYLEAAWKNIRWTLDCQEEDGYFNKMQFKEGEAPFLHTISYVIEGLMDSYEVLGDKSILDAAVRTVSALTKISLERDMLLCSQYGRNWVPVNKERCLTGLAQWAGMALRVYDRNGDEDLFTQAVKTIYYLKSKQYLRSSGDFYGGLPGSVPLWGKYLGFCYPNWSVKYFIDALIASDKYEIPVWREQETWVSESFRFSDAVVADQLGNNDRKYVGLIEKGLDTSRRLSVLDIGCGKGKFMRYFGQKYPHWVITGIDPSFPGYAEIRRGSVYSLPVPDGYADVVLLLEVMQHVGHLDVALAELSRVMKAGGVLVVGDKDRYSIIGFLKPLMEAAGRWMYPWDSPFREQWRSLRQWKKIFGDRWRITSAESFDNPDNRVPMSNRFYLLTAQKRAS